MELKPELKMISNEVIIKSMPSGIVGIDEKFEVCKSFAQLQLEADRLVLQKLKAELEYSPLFTTLMTGWWQALWDKYLR